MNGESVRYFVAGTVIPVGVVLRFRPDAGTGGPVAALVLVVVFAFGLSRVLTTWGLLLRAPSAVLSAGFMGHLSAHLSLSRRSSSNFRRFQRRSRPSSTSTRSRCWRPRPEA